MLRMVTGNVTIPMVKCVGKGLQDIWSFSRLPVTASSICTAEIIFLKSHHLPIIIFDNPSVC